MTEPLEGGARVTWSGDLKSGAGSLRVESAAGSDLPLLWPGSEADVANATSPEELTAAAHAACFAMTLAHTLERSGHTARTITVAAKATFGIADHAQTISRSQLDVSVDADGLDEPTLRHAAEVSGRYCPVSNTLRTGGVQLDVRTRMHSS